MVDTRRLALVTCTLADGASSSIGTGYLISSELLLTASHVVPPGAQKVQVRTESDGKWREALADPVWCDADLEAVLIRLREGAPGVGSVVWAEESFVSNVEWQAAGYPKAGKVEKQPESANHPGKDRILWKSVGLSGTLYAGGGGGQGSKQLDLGVDHPPTLDQWNGASGAPVIVEGRLAGFIKQVPPSFNGERLIGMPATRLFESPSFRIAIANVEWLSPDSLPKAEVWVLVILCEAEETQLGRWVDGALAKNQDAIHQVVHGSFEPTSVKVKIADAVQSPAHWLRFVRALCLAPVAVFDATDFEPAVMCGLGVRAVVRRGVTITSTARELTDRQLGQLPFNIKETRLLHHGSAYRPTDERNPLKALAAAIKKGWQESLTQPLYLDLPAYDGVRSPFPASSADDIGAVERILMLCPLSEAYGRNWLELSNTLAQRYAIRPAARMLDLVSPRLVGQALYEAIRWARTCVVDWTHWRANVFFEFGVRLACSQIGPICLIEADDAAIDPAGEDTAILQQKRLLLKLWRPTAYNVPLNDDPLPAAEVRKKLQASFDVHDEISLSRAPAVPLTTVPHDATYRICRESFSWAQEAITIEPHEALRRSVVEPFGPDPQNAGVQPILYADNAEFSLALEVSIRERWIAAWYYLANRYPQEQWYADPALRKKIRSLANQVLQFGPRKDTTDPHLRALRDTLWDVIDALPGTEEIEK